MKARGIALLLLALSAPLPALGSGSAEIRVKGMVCDFCSAGVKKRLGGFEEVDKVEVNLSTMRVSVKFKEGRTVDDARLKTAVQDSGFAVEGIERK